MDPANEPTVGGADEQGRQADGQSCRGDASMSGAEAARPGVLTGWKVGVWTDWWWWMGGESSDQRDDKRDWLCRWSVPWSSCMCVRPQGSG